MIAYKAIPVAIWVTKHIHFLNLINNDIRGNATFPKYLNTITIGVAIMSKNTYNTCQNTSCNKILVKCQKKYCSFSCQRKQNVADGIPSNFSKYIAEKKRTKIINKGRNCHNCNKPINPLIRPSHYKVQKYCSEKCSQQASIKYTKEERLALNNDAWWRYQMKKRQQMPPWADLDKIKEIYKNRPKGYHVDHIHPISKGGLHVHYNLQYLPAIDNIKKSNKI
jgi:hypothetical protein